MTKPKTYTICPRCKRQFFDSPSGICLCCDVVEMDIGIDELTYKVEALEEARRELVKENVENELTISEYRFVLNECLDMLKEVDREGRLCAHDHWDREMTHGANCPICNDQREVSSRLKTTIQRVSSRHDLLVKP